MTLFVRGFVVFIVAFLVTIAILALTSGCETEPLHFDRVSKFKNSVQYFRDNRGNCFAVIGIRKTGSAAMSGIGLSIVPDENCKQASRHK